ncbi:glycine--tRNA ligase subunit beta [Thermodesulfovibrio sp. 3907-1M]|uniref:Glycine--tRNA ligase beta subunit n=1 Tax=Thermodesulfovibrio autotrophicus TaxID=3118333 RepID=A0AAU8GUX0_9BACT
MNLLFEIGVEEIPARFIPQALNQLEENAKKIFSHFRINIEELKIYATPRRMVFKAKISQEQASEEKLLWGPPTHVAFDEEGKPKEPAYAFAKAHGLDVYSLEVKQKGKGSYVCAVIREKGKKTEEVLPEILKELFFSLSFPKMMRWGSGTIKFVRPVRWLMCLYNDKAVSFEIDGIKVEGKTWGHRFLTENPIFLLKIQDYEKALNEAFVIVDQEKRKQIIINQATELANKVNGRVLLDEELFTEVNYLVEFPNSVLCEFPEEYLSLPDELLITVMKDHQRYFAITDLKGKLKNYFIVVSNTLRENEENVRKGAQRVIKARFEDAKFYYEEDLKKGLDSLVNATKGIVYHEKLGSLYDKSLRILNIAQQLAEKVFPEKIESVRTAAKYCKADLASGVVGEFPELQGIIGGYYARALDLPREVELAIKEHYLPKGFTDALPSTQEGCLLSIADKLDHIASFFYLGEIPSGTEDPFGLRRAANGILAILLKKRYPLSIKDCVNTLKEFADEKIKQQISNFIGQRLESYFESCGYEVKLIKTVSDFILNTPVYEIEERLGAVKVFYKKENFESFFLAAKRVSNIIKNYEKFELNPSVLIAEEEKNLYNAMIEKKQRLDEYLINSRFLDALNYLETLTPVINNFFDRVLVMDKDENIRKNRVALLQELAQLLKSVADLSKLY